ncbi:hypothetical protein BOTBODRAFT_80956, partial [Botryobasidium botryosum FD-172 SS1]
MVCILLQAGADIRLQAKDLGGTALHYASGRGLISTVQLLLASGADSRARDIDGWTALHYAVESGDCSAEVILALLEAGADINARNLDGQTPLHRASRRHRPPSITQLLLESGASPHIRDNKGRTPLFHA